ncbi:ty3-gypsy retrotransposon protein [Tanacetum coccineum]
MGTVVQYQGEFEKLMNHVTDISEALLISFHISDLNQIFNVSCSLLSQQHLGRFCIRTCDRDGDDTRQDMEADAMDVVESGDVHVLIDNRSTHNFIQPDTVERMCLPVQMTKAFKVYIGSEESLLCENACSQATLSMQGLTMEVDIYVLPMKGLALVLGIQ